MGERGERTTDAGRIVATDAPGATLAGDPARRDEGERSLDERETPPNGSETSLDERMTPPNGTETSLDDGETPPDQS